MLVIPKESLNKLQKKYSFEIWDIVPFPLSDSPITLPEIDTSPVIDKVEYWERPFDQPLGLLPFRYKFWPWLISISVLYAVQVISSNEYCKSGFAGLDNKSFEVALAVTTTYDLLITFTSQVSVYPPSCVATRIVAVPSAFAVTFPSVSTVATFVSREVQVTSLFVASSGNTVAVKVSVPPTSLKL